MIPIGRAMIGDEEIKEVVEVFRLGMIVQGRKVAKEVYRYSLEDELE